MGEFSLTALRVVREVVERGSLSAAADRLGYTQSAVSRQVAAAEAAAARPLFERHARGVRPTAAGRVVARQADRVLAELETARVELERVDADAPRRLRIGAFSTALAALVPRAIASHQAHGPATDMLLREGLSPRLAGALATGRLDVAVVTHGVPGDAEVLLRVEDPLLLAVARGHRLAGERSVAPHDLRRERWIAGGTARGEGLLGAWTHGGWEPDVAYVARDWTAKLGLVAAAQGVTIVPGLAVPALAGTIAVVRIDHPLASRTTVAAVAADAAGTPHARAFGEALRDTAAELGADLRGRLRDQERPTRRRGRRRGAGDPAG